MAVTDIPCVFSLSCLASLEKGANEKIIEFFIYCPRLSFYFAYL